VSSDVAPVPNGGPRDELALLRGALLALTVTAVPVVGLAGWLVGAEGALGALVGIGLVAVLFGGSAAVLAFVAARRGGAGIGLLVGGAALRLPLYLAVLSALSDVPYVHGRSLAAAAAIAIAVTLAVELRLLARLPRLFWVDAAATRPSALAHDTRS
jgi:ATP synthase protein I